MERAASSGLLGLDLDRLLKLRLLVARFGEMDRARWWNTRGMLTRLGAAALRRGLPRTHTFAQARVVFAVAATRCREVFDPPRALTLWDLSAEVEDRFDARWSGWIEGGGDWLEFASEIQAGRCDDLLEEAHRLGLASTELLQEARQLRRSAEDREVQISGEHEPDDRLVTLLALGFSRGERGAPAIPYVRTGG